MEHVLVKLKDKQAFKWDPQEKKEEEMVKTKRCRAINDEIKKIF